MPKGKPINVEGVLYSSALQATKAYNINHNKYISRIRLGWTVEQALELAPPPNSFQVEGVVYSSIKELATVYGLNLKTVETRIARGWSHAQAVNINKPPRHYRSSYNNYLFTQGLRLCAKCDIEQSIDQYYKKDTDIGLGSYCRQCIKIQVRNDSRRRQYGLDIEAWNILFDSQDKKCAICHTDKPGKVTWHTDHCHITNRIRGILCHSCNTGLGHFRDDISVLNTAVEYLKKNQNNDTYIDAEKIA